MNNTDLLKIYLAALEKSLSNDHMNFGFLVEDYTFFIKDMHILPELEQYLESDIQYRDFFELIEYYFFSKSHYENTTNGIDNHIVKSKILSKVSEIKKSYGW